MSDLESLVATGVAKRVDAIARLDRNYRAMQEEKLRAIVRNCADTEFGRAHGFDAIDSWAAYRRAVPPSTARDYVDPWRRIAAGERGVLFPEPVYAYCLTSGTTDVPKTVPINKALVRGHKRAIGYTVAHHMHTSGNFSLLRGYALQMAAPGEERAIDGKPVGYITGTMGLNRTYPFHNIAIPAPEIVNEPDWTKKYAAIADRYADHDVRMVFGIPGYILGLLDRLPPDHWPGVELVVTSGAALDTYRDVFAKRFPGAAMREMYLCSEAAIAFQRSDGEPGMVPMAEDVVLEFVAESDWGREDAPRFGLGEVETGQRYVVLVTTPAGLYAYSPGDVVEFTQVDPPRLLVRGRLGLQLNLVAEKLDEEQAEQALRAAGVAVAGFTVCPAAGEPARHEWVVEFDGPAPPDAGARIDAALRAINPIYHRVREGDTLMAPPLITPVPRGTFEAALRRRSGQGKVLRIYRDRAVRDELAGSR